MSPRRTAFPSLERILHIDTRAVKSREPDRTKSRPGAKCQRRKAGQEHSVGCSRCAAGFREFCQHQVTPSVATTKPSNPPLSARSTLSVNNCRTMRTRLAPNAERMANSRVLAAERASKRLATFVLAISRTIHTAPSRTGVFTDFADDRLLQRLDIGPQVPVRGRVEPVEICLNGVNFSLRLTNLTSGLRRPMAAIRGWCDRNKARRPCASDV